jgi:nucleotide-binding universal stress UspA family protein
MKRILVATDGSDGAGRALDYAAELAKGFGADLLIVNVIGGYGLPGEIFRRFTRSESAWLDELLEANSAELLAKARDRARELGVTNVEIESRSGEVIKTITDIAKDKNVDAIVVGKHGAGGVQALLLGSITQKLVSLSSQPVLVVP